MNPAQLIETLDQLRRLPHETEWVEFKEAKDGFDFRKLGKYFSALSNEANLANQPCAWLVFGVRDDRSV
jgi:ATP-dependent DNA helicase RecG